MLPDYVIEIIDALKSRGYPAFVVGGCVRDMVIGRQPRDYDIITPAGPEAVKSIFAKTIGVGAKFGTVLVVIDGNTAEVSSLKGRPSLADSQLPKMLEEDLGQRDFTINAMAMDPAGTLYDPWGGLADIERRVIRATGDNASARFNEDPLRMMRAIRLCVAYGFEMDDATFREISRSGHLIQAVSAERIRDELNDMLVCKEPSRAVRLMHDSGLLRFVLPEVEAMFGFDQRNPRHDRDLFEHTMAVLDGVPGTLKVRWAALLHDSAKPDCFALDEGGRGHFYGHQEEGQKIAAAVMKRLKFDNQSIEDVSILVGEHMSQFSRPHGTALKRLVNRVGEKNLDDLFALQRADIGASAPPYEYQALDSIIEEAVRLLSESRLFTVRDLAINGTDLIEIGFVPGPELGRILNHLLDLVLEDPELNQKESLLEIARQFA